MLRFIFATFFVSFAVGFSVLDENLLVIESSSDDLEWPEIYTLKATKLSLTSNLVEDFQVWSTNTSARVDFNGGAVKSLFVMREDGENSTIYAYEIHPETTDGETTEVACNVMVMEGDNGLYSYNLKTPSILPDLNEEETYEPVANETINDKETIKFEYEGYDNDEEVRRTIWAYYADFYEAWVPVRFEDKLYNSILGALTKHDIWEFTDFDPDVDEDVFNVVDDVCETENTVYHTADSEKVTKDLMFVHPNNKHHVDYVFNSYIKKFQREYAHEKEHALRKAIFRQNMRMVSTVNKKKLGYTLAINHFSDRTPEELERSRGLKRRPAGKTGNVAFPYDESSLNSIVQELPSEYDLRLEGLISPVKNQGDCGSCWTFGTTSAVEGALARVNGGRLLSLSNQALVDCVWVYGAAGCEGGTDNAAYEWMMDYGLPTEEEYGPYRNKDDYCHIANMSTIYPIRGFTDVTPFSNNATKVAVVNHGPLSTSVHVSTQFSHYSSGIFYQYECDPTYLNHEVTMVGYGEKDGDLFWILKNSWGVNWGIDGYMLISAKDNTCGATTEPTYVVF